MKLSWVRKREIVPQHNEQTLLGFDDIPVTLGDTMRGERATMGKSILDVDRDLRINAKYLLAIENADLSAFDTPSFVAGYVRSYARYLSMDPEAAFATFCEETGFDTGQSGGFNQRNKSQSTQKTKATQSANIDRDFVSSAKTPFLPSDAGHGFSLQPQAIGSLAVLIAVVAGLAYGGFSLLRQIQKVNIVASDQQPSALVELDPIASVVFAEDPLEFEESMLEQSVAPLDGMVRAFQPAPLDQPVLVPRDGPIAALDPKESGAYVQNDLPGSGLSPLVASDNRVKSEADRDAAKLIANIDADKNDQKRVQVVSSPPENTLSIFAVKPAWVRVSASDGSVIFEKILQAGEGYQLPSMTDAPLLRAGMSGMVYARLGDQIFGPFGEGTKVVKNVVLAHASIKENYALAEPELNDELAQAVAMLQTTGQQ